MPKVERRSVKDESAEIAHLLLSKTLKHIITSFFENKHCGQNCPYQRIQKEKKANQWEGLFYKDNKHYTRDLCFILSVENQHLEYQRSKG